MKKTIFILLFSVAFKLLAQTNHLEEVVYLKNGSIIRGTIIEQVINDKIKVQTSIGNVFVYKYEEIEKITKEPKFLASSDAINVKGAKSELRSHKAKGIGYAVSGATLFTMSLPLMFGGAYDLYYNSQYYDYYSEEILFGAMLFTASIPLLVAGSIHFSKFSKLKKEANKQTGLFINPNIGMRDNTGLTNYKGSKDLIYGASLTYKF